MTEKKNSYCCLKKRIFLDGESVREIVDALKSKKGLTQKSVSEAINSHIESVLKRGSSIPYDSCKKLELLSRTVDLRVKVIKIKYEKYYGIDSMKKLARKIGLTKTGKAGKFLSKAYKGMNKPHEWQCGKCGRIWKATPNGIMYQNNWCRKCSNRETWSYEQMCELAKIRGLDKTGVEGKLLTNKKTYENTPYPDGAKYTWECGKCGFVWEATANNVKRGSWCRNCQYSKLSRIFRLSYEEVKALAKEIGKIKTGYAGEFLAKKEEYENIKTPSHHKFEWRCGKCNSTFEMDVTHVKRPQWCPTCTEGESEIICRWFFEEIFGAKFPKTRPKWLKNDKTGGQMELDGYCDALKLAFEFNGPQHYTFYPKFHKTQADFARQLERDALKLKLCKDRGITLIVVPYTLDYNGFQEYITKKYKKLTGKILENRTKHDWRNFKIQKVRG